MSITFRPGSIEDSYTVYQIFLAAISDLGRRTGTMAITGGNDPAVMASLWEMRRPLFEHLAQTAEQFWLAEQAGRPVGYARSIRRDGLHELTEFFVLPEAQSAGVGRELLARAFPQTDAERRSIIATVDTRAQTRYLKLGVVGRFPCYYLDRSPEVVSYSTDLVVEPLTPTQPMLATLAAIDKSILGHRRDVDHQFLMTNRLGSVYYRRGQAVGYGYVGHRSGPFALLDPNDFPAVLAHAESQAAQAGQTEMGLDVPGVNRHALLYLLARGYKVDAFMTLMMSDEPFGTFERYILTTPAFFI